MELKMERVSAILQLIVVILVHCKTINAQLNYTDVINKVDAFVAQTLSCKPVISGFSLSVVKDGEVVMAKGYGFANKESGKRVNENTVFGIASLSKAFTTTLLMKIVDRLDNVTLNTPVTDILGRDFAFKDEQLNRYATLQDLMSHRLGLPTHNYIRYQNLTRSQLARLFQYIKPKGEFRNSFIYNNIVYGLLTHITEVLGGRSWEVLMEREIFRPLAMNHTSFSHTIDLQDPDVAVGYTRWRDGRLRPVPRQLSRHWGRIGGSGSVMSTAQDMTAWMTLHLSLGKNRDGQKVMEAETLRANHESRVVMPAPSVTNYIKLPEVPATFSLDRYASAWRNGYYRGYPTVSHTGATYGYRAMLVFYPSQSLGIFMALNGEDPGVRTRTMLQTYIADLMLAVEPWANLSTACTFPEPWNKGPEPETDPPATDRGAVPSRPLKTYVGKYSTPLYGIMEVTENQESNYTNCLRLDYGVSSWDLYPIANSDNFTALGTGMVEFFKPVTMVFSVPNTGGEPQAVSLKIPSFDVRDTPVLPRIDNRCESGCHSHARDEAGSVQYATGPMLTALLLGSLLH